MQSNVTDRSPWLSSEKRVRNVLAGLCHCGCPAFDTKDGWRRCIWSPTMEHRLVFDGSRLRVIYRNHSPRTDNIRWNDAKQDAGLLNDRYVHALLLWMVGWLHP